MQACRDVSDDQYGQDEKRAKRRRHQIVVFWARGHSTTFNEARFCFVPRESNITGGFLDAWKVLSPAAKRRQRPHTEISLTLGANHQDGQYEGEPGLDSAGAPGEVVVRESASGGRTASPARGQGVVGAAVCAGPTADA